MKFDQYLGKALIYTVIFLCISIKSIAQIQKGPDIDGEAADDRSGSSVCMPDSNTLAIGAIYNNGNGNHAGHVRIYSWNGSTWLQKGLDIDGEAAGDWFGGSVDMPDSNTVAIGAIYNDGNGTDAGHVRVFTWNGSVWMQKGLDIDGEAAGDFSGQSVSMPNPNTVAIGAPLNDGNLSDSGHARIYSWNGSAWVQKGSDINGEASGDLSGVCVCMPDSNTVAIGANHNDGTAGDAGHVRIYSWNGSAWIQKGADIDGEAELDYFGWAVSMPDTNTVAIGGNYNDDNGTDAGHVRVFTWNGSAWIQKGVDIDGESAGDRSGWSVSMPDTNTLAIGAFNNYNQSGYLAGQVRIYTWVGNAWVQKGIDIDGEAAFDESGFSLSMSDAKTVAIGAPTNDGNGVGSGHVRVYSDFNVTIQVNDFETSLIGYPNPTYGNLTLDLGNEYTNIIVSVRNELGQLVGSQDFENESKFELTLPVESGIYFIQVKADNLNALVKVIKR